MKRFKILFIFSLLFLTSSAKPFKESTIDNENTSQAIIVPPSGLVNKRESIALYLKNDDILNISEFSTFYNPGAVHFNNVQFIKETDSDYVEKVRSINFKTTLATPKLEVYNEENKTGKNVDATIVDSEEESKLEGVSTKTKDIDSIAISIEGQGKTAEEGYEDDLEVPENIKSTERYFKIDILNDETNSDGLDEIRPQIQSRRSLLPNKKVLLDTEGKNSNKSPEIVDVNQDSVPKSDVTNFDKPNDQSKVESTSETPFDEPQLIQLDPAISDKQFNDPSPVLTLETPGSADLSEISNGETTNVGDKQSNNLKKSGKISLKEKTIDDFNSNIYENAYPYTRSKVKSVSQQRLATQPNTNSFYSKLLQASGNPSINSGPSRQSLGNYRTLPNFNLQNQYLQNVGLHSLVPRTRRFFFLQPLWSK